MPTASSDILEAQRKRFDELKVCVCCAIICGCFEI